MLRLLEAQLQSQSRHHRDELEALNTQIELLRGDIEKKQEMLNYAASLSPEAKVEYSVQQEITRLTDENLVRDSDAMHSSRQWLTAAEPLRCFYSAGPQRAGGETGKEWEEAQKAAPHLHEKGSGVRRYLLLFTTATVSESHMIPKDCQSVCLSALQLLRQLLLRVGPSRNWVVRWPSRGRRKILKGCWSTWRRRKPTS